MIIDPTTLHVGDVLITDNHFYPRQRAVRYFRNTAADGTPNDYIRSETGHTFCLWQIQSVEPWTTDSRPLCYPWSKWHSLGDPVKIIDKRD